MNSLFKALSHPARRRMVAMLREGPMASGDIAGRFDMAWPTVTTHLAALKAAGLVETEKDGAIVANVSNQFLSPTAFSSVKYEVST